MLQQHDADFFEIAREPATISFEEFEAKYLLPEIPVIIEGVATDWPARTSWTEDSLRQKLAQDSKASSSSLWYWMERDSLKEDFITPEFVNRCLDAPYVFPRTQHIRIWAHQQGNVSSWHYDGGMVNVFNVQVKGQKEWFLVSPDTPLDCYPFTSYTIIKNSDDVQLKGKRFTHFIANEGDMVYIPPVWFHKVISRGTENVNLNWLFTKSHTDTLSKTMIREYERYQLDHYLKNHRFKWVSLLTHKFNGLLPAYVKVHWRYPAMITLPYKLKPYTLGKRFVKELAMLGKTLLNIHHIRPYLKTVKSVQKLNKK